MFKKIALAINCSLTMGFFLCVRPLWFVFASPLFHALAFISDPHCHHQHCQPMKQYEKCIECGMRQWVRMHHCYRCGVCVHKYDHHCILLGVCVGEANQKYYFLFLWAHLLSSLAQMQGYFGQAGDYIWMDEAGYQHMQALYVLSAILIIFSAFNAIVVGYLCVYHTRMIAINETTYQLKKRPHIKYFHAGTLSDEHPFDLGVAANLRQVFGVSSSSPIEWELPQPCQP